MLKKNGRDARYAQGGDDSFTEEDLRAIPEAGNGHQGEPPQDLYNRDSRDQRERPAPTTVTRTAPRGESVVDAHSSFDGRYETEHDLRVEGTASGEVLCRGAFTVEKDATVRARITAQDANLRGRFEGDVICTGRLLISASAIVSGTFKAATLVVEEGATISGTVETTPLGAQSVRPEITAVDTDADTPAGPGSANARPRREVPNFALVSSDERKSIDRN